MLFFHVFLAGFRYPNRRESYFQYGTTLLYSIEESDQEVTTAGSAVSAAVVSGDGAPATASVAPEDPPAEGGQGPSATDVDEDMQIAWENFEAARSIMESMMVKPQSNGDLTEMLSLDLAQIYLREGDLQRMNGRNEAAIQDYQSCLRLRKQSKFLDKWDRKLADVHYQLGLVYINFASKDDDDEDGANTDGKKVEDEKAKEAKRIVARNKSVYHFLECSKCFCGQIASICNADPGSVIKIQPGDLDNEANEDKTPKFKTTGEEDEEMELPKVASSKLSTMRKRVTALIASADLTTEQREKVNDLSQLLEDIQETVDEAENSTKGVQQVSNMKAEVAALAAADGDIEPLSEGNSTTTIGFGAATTTTAASAATTSSASAFASANVAAAAAAAPPAAARPMMVVKKKKRAALQTVQEPESKKPKPEAE